MGLLDDAIREHLDLKRARGGDPAEIERMEREALGPVRREPSLGSTRFADEDRDHPAARPRYPDDHDLEDVGYRDSTAPHRDLHHEHLHHEALDEHEHDGAFASDPEEPEPPKRRFLRRSRPSSSRRERGFHDEPHDELHDRPGYGHAPEPFPSYAEEHLAEHPEPVGGTAGFEAEHAVEAEYHAPEAEHHVPEAERYVPEADAPEAEHHTTEAEHRAPAGERHAPGHRAPEVEPPPPVQPSPPVNPPHLQFEQPPKRPRFTAEPPGLRSEPATDSEPATAVEPATGTEPPAPSPAPAAEAEHPIEAQETTEFDVAGHIAEAPRNPETPAVPDAAVPDAAEGRPAPDEDVLEETPEFLQDTPEHDRLWFEQRPPRDFDF